MNKWRRRARKWRKLYRAQTYLLGVEQEYSADGRTTLHEALLTARKWRKAFRGQRRIAKSWIKHGDKCERQLQEYRRQGNEAIREVTDQREALLAWQRGVREAWEAYAAIACPSGDPECVVGALRQAIESDGRGET
jgi:hypothetical protein